MGLFEPASTRWRHAGVAAAAAALALGAPACGDDESDSEGQGGTAATTEPAKKPAAPAAEVPLTGGQTTLVLAGTLDRLLDTAGVEVRPAGAAESAPDGGIAFPITRGGFEQGTVQGRAVHDGGITFAARGRTARATDLVLDTRSRTLTATIEGEKVDLLGLDLDGVEPQTSGNSFRATGIEATLGDQAADVLNDALGLSVLGGGVPVGELSIRGETA